MGNRALLWSDQLLVCCENKLRFYPIGFHHLHFFQLCLPQVPLEKAGWPGIFCHWLLDVWTSLTVNSEPGQIQKKTSLKVTEVILSGPQRCGGETKQFCRNES
ncbi:hypothetical protein ILYODFUR_010243 [Ilyodon furcidens]|uniref:Uncharacterized protein n=1 Tax=Ilyodon furcidens TaxID=33524 RepID=A0ABV0SYU1_9TELE